MEEVGERKAAQRTLRCLYVGLGGGAFGEICRLLDTLFKTRSFVNESGDQPFERRVYAGEIFLGHRRPAKSLHVRRGHRGRSIFCR